MVRRLGGLLPVLVAVVALVVSVVCVATGQIVAKLRLAHFGTVPLDHNLPGYVARLALDFGMWFVVLATVCGAIFYYVGMSRLPLNSAIFMTALVYPAVAIGSFIFLGETASVIQIGGMMLVGIGVVIVLLG